MQPSSMQSAVAVSELVPEVAEVVDEEASEAEAVKHILEVRGATAWWWCG